MIINIAQKVAEDLLRIEAIKLNPNTPFKWSSGWNSPIYCDNRLSLSYPDTRNFIKNSIIEMIKTNFPSVECIAGVATAGIPQGAIVADCLNLPFLYVRPKAKEHGMKNLIEGKITEGQKVVIIEDLISTGGSSLKAAQELIDAKFEILGMVAIFTYGFQTAVDNFNAANIKLLTLSNYEVLINLVENKNMFSQEDINSLKEWRLCPENWKSTE